MSAASPVPVHNPATSPHNPSHPPPANSNVGGGGGGRGAGGGGDGGGERVFAHIHDLQAKAADGYNPRSTIAQLLDVAERGISQAHALVGFRRPDLAFVEYLRAFEILVNVVPRHPEFTHITYDQPERATKLALLTKRVNGMSEQYANIKDIIVKNNMRNAISPLSALHRPKPTPSPKPDKLHGRPVSTADSVSARFAQLRIITPPDLSERREPSTLHPSPLHTSPIPMPSAGDSNGRASLESISTVSSRVGRLHGPRNMPSTNPGPPIPAKLTTSFPVAMPQEPKATYSPARNMETTGNIAPPRHSARSLANSNARRTSNMPPSAAAAHAPNVPPGEYFPSTAGHNASHGQMQRRRSVNMPKEIRISPERLYDYLERFNILIIDFRSRAEFDQGHIYARNVVCIEPFSIKQGMSADQLLESMVVSPDGEQDMFYHRDEYDLVVYYDGGTQSEGYLEHPTGFLEQQLKYLHETLYDFNQDKPLQRPPILLVGGLEAWTDLVGHQALISSSTMARVKQARPIQRHPPATAITTGNSEVRVSKRRAREWKEINPLNDEEQKYWAERARAESVVLPPTPNVSSAPGRDNSGPNADGAPDDGDDAPGSAIREFLERFPEAGKLTDRQYFAGTVPARAPPEPPMKVPMYPSPPPSSAYPSVPTRPMPAAPRMSYTGVSDRAASVTTPAPRSASGAPYIPSKYLATNLRLPRTGLLNFGNTCYMNSTVQALSATTPLSVFFLDDTFNSQIQRSNWRANSKGVMAELYSNLIRSLWKGDVDSIRPTTFRKFCGRTAQVFESDGVQQDAKEFLDFLLDCLHEDLNLTWSKTPLRALNEQEEAKRERMPKLVVARLEWNRYVHRDLSFVQGLFGGQHLSKLTCQTCGFTSSTYEYFSSISVEIPTDPRRYSHGRFPTLDDCLRSYCTEEVLSADEAWNCPHCRVPRETSKRITITRAPQTLIVHFKRFGNTGQNTRKIRVPVFFPLEELDLGPYMLAPPSAAEAQAIARDYGPQSLKTEESMTPPYTYDAYAVVRHIGATMQSGHYVTAVKDRARQKWRLFNDAKVDDFRPEDLRGGQALQNEEAYIVFYSRRQRGDAAPGSGKM